MIVGPTEDADKRPRRTREQTGGGNDGKPQHLERKKEKNHTNILKYIYSGAGGSHSA